MVAVLRLVRYVVSGPLGRAKELFTTYWLKVFVLLGNFEAF